jgi:hypothetical protein
LLSGIKGLDTEKDFTALGDNGQTTVTEVWIVLQQHRHYSFVGQTKVETKVKHKANEELRKTIDIAQLE